MTFSARSSHALTTLKSKVTELNPGLSIRRVLPQAKQRAVGSFVFLDHFGPTLSKMTVGPHPHIGLSTLTYLYQGSIVHRDSTGAHQIILPNQVNWMSSGRGVTHSERSEAGTMHGLQIWVALPKDQEDAEPSFHHASSVIPVSIDSDCAVQLVVGKFLGYEQPDIPLLSGTGELFLLDVNLRTQGATWSADLGNGLEVGIYVSSGKIRYRNTETAQVGDFIVDPSGQVHLEAIEPETRVALLGGSPLPERRHLLWNFCSHDPAKLKSAVKAWNDLDRSVFPPVVGEPNIDSIPMPKH